jgi:DNA recombination protein RmuC
VAYGWRESRLTENAEEIARLGAELHNRAGIMADHLAKVGRGIATTTKAFNDAVGSFEGSVSVTTRKFEELGAKSGREVKALEPVTDAVREVKGAEPALVLPSGAVGGALDVSDEAGVLAGADDTLVLGQ